MTASLSCQRLKKTFNGQVVLDNIILDIDRGECLVLLGPSGCGKTTLLNILNGILSADSGELHCDGTVLDAPARGIHIPMQRRRFAMVFQDFSLWPHMTVAANVAFGLRMQGLRRAEREQRTREVLKKVQMEAFMDRLPDQLSGGQQQRVAIARALAVQPRVLLFDEPLSALDARLREDMKHELAQLLRETGVTAVYVTHDQQEAFTLGNRVALMHQGRIAQVGTPESLYEQPASSFVASFVGNSNLLAYRRYNGHILLDGELPVQVSASEAPESGQFMIRRESIAIYADANGANDSRVSLSGTCEQHHFLGDRREAFVRLHNGQRLRGLAHQDMQPGQTVQVRFAADAIRFLAD